MKETNFNAEIYVHTVRCPFPYKTNSGKVVVDEVCYCGARRSVHFDTGLYGHGANVRNNCPKFQWKEHVFA